MKDINKFSIRRVNQLINMELRIEGRKLLIFSLVQFIGLVLIALVTGYSSISYESFSSFWGFEMLLFFMLMVYMVYFTFTMNKRIRRSNTIAYSAIPSSTGERFLSILLLGLLCFFIAILVAQLTMSALLLINPSAGVILSKNHGDVNLIANVGGFYYYNIIEVIKLPFRIPCLILFLTMILYVIISSKAAFGWNANTWWEKLIFVVAIIAIIMISRFGHDYPALLSSLPTVMWVMAGGFLVGSYFRLKYIEQL